MTEPDWLEAPPGAVVPATAIPRDVLTSNPQYQLLVEAMAALTPKQRQYVRVMPAAHFAPMEAMRLLEAAGISVSQPTIYRWNSDPDVKRAVELHRDVAGAFAGIDSVSVMLRVDSWARYCMEEVTVVDKKGREIRKRRDPANGLKALELLGKHTGALGKEEDKAPAHREGPGLVIQINSTQQPTIDVTPDKRVVIDLPRPGKC